MAVGARPTSDRLSRILFFKKHTKVFLHGAESVGSHGDALFDADDRVDCSRVSHYGARAVVVRAPILLVERESARVQNVSCARHVEAHTRDTRSASIYHASPGTRCRLSVYWN